jgi:hypothetical protein
MICGLQAADPQRAGCLLDPSSAGNVGWVMRAGVVRSGLTFVLTLRALVKLRGALELRMLLACPAPVLRTPPERASACVTGTARIAIAATNDKMCSMT